jgi:hypothetical protein
LDTGWLAYRKCTLRAGFLAEALRARVEAFQPFSRWSEIARELASRELA